MDVGVMSGELHGLRHNFRFLWQRKKSVWEAWNAYVEVTEAFNNLMNHPYMTMTVNCKEFQLLERFTVIIYNKKSNLDSVNEARRELFSQKKQDNGEHSPNARSPSAAHTARSLPSWNLGNQ
ncbi:hypothetical protein GWK47_031652 [Chionoecetes opilio]|uniref:Uncharacterized protein n=1 Tax=Chionoecetes opilio TaxID=41210 RepID=A0A8J4YKY1_CHIOP|nr:hypothetical protein GWK47_031652 [Chionoecetes opilio]